LSCLQDNLSENNVEPVSAKFEKNFGGNSFYIIFQRIVLGLISFRLKKFFWRLF
jgi:hypothetical protein